MPRVQQSDWWRGYANDPLMRAVVRDIARDIEAHIEDVGLRFAMPDDVAAVEVLPRTPDGSVDRAGLPRRETALPTPASEAEPAGSIEESLAALWRDILEVDEVGRNDNFFDLGGDSMRGIQVVAQAKQLGLDLAFRDLLEHQTVAELAAAVRAAAGARGPDAESPETEVVSGVVPLGPPLRRLIEATDEDYVIERVYVYRFACRRLLRLAPLTRAIEHLVRHHDALRIELRRDAAGMALWNAELPRPASELLAAIDLSHLEEADQQAGIDGIALKLRDVTDPGTVPMVRFALIDRGDAQPQMLLVAVHHAIWDPITVGIFFDDLRSAYDQAARNCELRLPPKTSSVKRWAECLEAQGPSIVADELDYWRERLTGDALVLPLDGAPVAADVFSGFSISRSLTSHETRAIQQLAREEAEASLEDVLLAAVGIAITKWTGKPQAGINLIQHGRDRLMEGVDVSRTVGWFSSDYPVILDFGGLDRLVDAVTIARNAVREVPRNGIGYSILRYVGRTRPLASYPQPRIMLNHFGAGTVLTSGPLQHVGFEGTAPSLKYINSPGAPIQVTSRIVRGALDIDWAANETVVRESTARALAESTASTLRQLIGEWENAARRKRAEYK